jgi:hypothetical protein
MKFKVGDEVIVTTTKYGSRQKDLQGVIISVPRHTDWYTIKYNKESRERHGTLENSYREADMEKITKLHKVLK